MVLFYWVYIISLWGGLVQGTPSTSRLWTITNYSRTHLTKPEFTHSWTKHLRQTPIIDRSWTRTRDLMTTRVSKLSSASCNNLIKNLWVSWIRSCRSNLRFLLDSLSVNEKNRRTIKYINNRVIDLPLRDWRVKLELLHTLLRPSPEDELLWRI